MAISEARRWDALLVYYNTGELRQILQTPAPSLKLFSLIGPGMTLDRNITLFQNHAPVLKVVTISGFSLNWSSQMPMALHILKILDMRPYAAIHPRDMLNILVNCPDLTILHLKDALDMFSRSFAPSNIFHTLVHLPKLQRLFMEVETWNETAMKLSQEAYISVLNALVLAATTKVSLKGFFHSSENVASWVRRESRRWPCQDLLQIRVDEGGDDDYGSVRLRYGDGDFEVSGSTTNTEPNKAITDMLFGMDETRRANTKASVFEHDGPIDTLRKWLDLLNRSLPALAILTVGVPDVEKMLPMFDKFDSEDGSRQENWLFSLLVQLQIRTEPGYDVGFLDETVQEMENARLESEQTTDLKVFFQSE